MEWINNGIFIHGILYGNENELTTTGKNMKRSHNDVDWKKSQIKRAYMGDYNNTIKHVKVTYGVRSQDSGYLWSEGVQQWLGGQEEGFWDAGNVPFFILVMAIPWKF